MIALLNGIKHKWVMISYLLLLVENEEDLQVLVFTGHLYMKNSLSQDRVTFLLLWPVWTSGFFHFKIQYTWDKLNKPWNRILLLNRTILII